MLIPFARTAFKRFSDESCLETAASLSYASLLATVPLAAIVFAVLAVVPAFAGVRETLEVFLFENMLPDTGQKVAGYFNMFVENARGMTHFGIAGLVVVAVMLFNRVFQAFNGIFNVERPRTVWMRLGIFLIVLVMGPLVAGASFTIATYILALTKGAGVDVEAFTGIARLARVVPALIMIVGLSVAYKVIPNCRVGWRDAFIGGVTAGLLFSGLRWGFGLYLIYFPTYRAIYGALSAVPVFLLWMYLSWAVILLGAAITAAAPEHRGEA